MAKTTFATNNALTKKLFDEKLFRDMVKESYFSKFFAEKAESIVHTKSALEKSQGDKISFGIRMRLTGAGITSSGVLEGNEEALSTYDSSVSLEEYAHAVRDKGPLDRQRAMFSIETESKDALQDWGAERIDKLCFDTILASPTKILYPDGSAGAFSGTGTAATAKTAMSATNSKLTTKFISAARTWAKTGGNRAYVPMRPVKVEGKDYYVMLVSPNALFDLKVDSTFQGALKDAQVRGPTNPLFQGAVAIWDQVVIHEHDNITTFTNGGASDDVAGCFGVVLGAQSLVWAWGTRPQVVQETFDYGRSHGHAWSIIAGCAKPVFNSLDYGSVGICLASTNVSGK